MSALPYIAMYICSFIFASLCDLCIKRKWHSIGTGRKIYTTICELTQVRSTSRQCPHSCTLSRYITSDFATNIMHRRDVDLPCLYRLWCGKQKSVLERARVAFEMANSVLFICFAPQRTFGGALHSCTCTLQIETASLASNQVKIRKMITETNNNVLRLLTYCLTYCFFFQELINY